MTTMNINMNNLVSAVNSAKNMAEQNRVAQEQARVKAIEDFMKYGYVYDLVSSTNGYTAIVRSGVDSEKGEILAPVSSAVRNEIADKKGETHVVKANTATLYNIGKIIANLLRDPENVRNNLAFVINDGEVRRVAGMIGRIRKGESGQLTEKELEHINDNRAFDDAYVAVANGLAGVLKAAIDAGYKISVASNSDLHSFSLRYQPNNVKAFAGKTVRFMNGFGTVGTQKLRINNYNLNGEHKLVEYNGKLSVEREVTFEKSPATFIAQSLLTIASYTVNNARALSVADEDAVDDSAMAL